MICLILFSYWLMHPWWTHSLSELEGHFIPCPVKLLTGCDCPACGTQRSIIELLKGEFAKSWELNPLGIGLVLFFLVFVTSSRFDSQTRGRTRNLYLLLLLVVVMVRWITGLI